CRRCLHATPHLSALGGDFLLECILRPCRIPHSSPRSKPHGLIEKLQKWFSLQCHNAQFSENFLLTNPLLQCARDRIGGHWTWFHHWLRVFSCIIWGLSCETIHTAGAANRQ